MAYIGNSPALDETVSSSQIVDLTVATADIAADAITNAKIADGQVDTEHLAALAVETAKIGADAVTNAKIGDGEVDTEHLAASAVETAKINNDAVTLAKMAGGTDGNIISYDASGDPVAIATGTDGQVLTSTGAGSPPAMEDAPSFDADAAQVFNDSGADVDFRVEGSGQANALFVDGANGTVHVGNATVGGANGQNMIVDDGWSL